ncbi:MAG TPA: long-chain fatty acid--CoA ligase [Acidimicrobiia bacterium]|nr:long-chain fatty acid--CoA ligase [Acidimicrobiia bacterium]
MNVGQMLVQAAQRTPQRPAVTWGDRTITYAELDRRTNALAHGLADRGVRQGDRVGVLMRNRTELLEAMYACFKAGYCLVPLNSRFTADDVAYHVADSGAAAVITDPEGIDVVGAAGLDGVVVVAAGEGYEELVASSDPASAVAPVDRDDLAWLFYTSGTTGRPKGAMLTHGNLAFVTASWLADLTPMDEHGVTLHAAPLSHGAGFHALATTARGAHHVIPAATSFDPAGVLALLADEGVTNTWMVPTQIVMLVDALGDTRPDLPALEQIVYGGAPFAPAELRRAVEALGPVLVQLFGQGETPMTATMLPAADHAAALAGDRPERLASAGFARPGMDVRVLDDDGRELPVGEVGEACVRGPAVMLGYWNRPEASAEALHDGWLHTGDLGRFDEHGYLYLLDRAKDLIISGGSNVYAVEVEAALADHPAVREVAVIGLPDRTWGEVVTAVVVSDDGPDVEAALTEHCAVSLAGYKRPRRYRFVDSLPRNAYGKVLKRDLRATLAEGEPT